VLVSALGHPSEAAAPDDALVGDAAPPSMHSVAEAAEVAADLAAAVTEDAPSGLSTCISTWSPPVRS
jgi:hypothetical protein